MAKRQSAAFWQDHLEAWKLSGLTQIAYCANNELHIKAFSRRLHQKRVAAQLAKSPLTLVPANVGIAYSASINTAIILHSPAGWRVELASTHLGHPVTGLADLLRQLP